MKKTKTIVDVLTEPPEGELPEKYHYSRAYDAFMKIGWETEPEIATRQDFPIPHGSLLLVFSLTGFNKAKRV